MAASQSEINMLKGDFTDQYNQLSLKMKEVIGENESLHKQLNESKRLTGRISHPENTDFIATQLMETEHVLSQERQQAVRAMNQASTVQKQNEQLRRYIQQSQAQFNQLKQQLMKQVESLTKQNRDLKIVEKERALEIDELKGKILEMERLLETKADILQKTKDERDQINMQSHQREIEVDNTKINLMTKTEANDALRNQVHLLKGQYSSAERKMIDLNNLLVASNQKKDEMGMKLRELEEIVQRSVKREMELGIKERHVEQFAEDCKLELNEAKAKITNLAFQLSSMKEQNKNILDEMGDKIRTAKEEIKSKANEELHKMNIELDELQNNGAKLIQDAERAKREKRSVEETLEEVLKSRKEEIRNNRNSQLQSRINDERRLKDQLGEQIRSLLKKNEVLRNELTEREEWNKSDMAFAKQTDDNRKLEINKMRNALDEIKNENIRVSQNVVKEQVAKEKIEKFLKEQISDLSEQLHHKDLKIKGQNVDGLNSLAIRELQEELSNARMQSDRWKQEAIQVAQEADSKIRGHRSEIQNFRLDNQELRADLKELVEKNADFARQVAETDRDRAQLNARIVTLQQKLKPFLVKQ